MDKKPKVKSPELHSGTLNGVLYGCIWHHNNGPLQHHISATWPVQTTTCWQCYSTWTWPKVLWFRSKLKLASGCTPRVWLVDLLGHSYHYLLNSDLAQHHSCIYTIYYLFLSNWNLERIHFEKWKYNCMSRSFIKSTLFLMQLSQLVIHQMGPISRWWII